MPALRTVLALLACAAAALGTGDARAQECPQRTFLRFEHLVYAEAGAPPASTSDEQLAIAGTLGPAELDVPAGDDGCERRLEQVEVVRLAGFDPAAAVGVAGRRGQVWVLGARCDLPGGNEQRWACLTRPLRFLGVAYTGLAGTRPAASDPLGEGELGGDPVPVVALEGVDPALAVGVAGAEPGTIFVAPGVCPYERSADDEAADDLARCLQNPLWLSFDPPGARSGVDVEARADRPLPDDLAGAEVSLVRITRAVDALPADRSQATAVGTLGPARTGEAVLAFAAPDLDTGVYEAVAECARCRERFGATAFPLGSLLVVAGSDGGSSAWKAVALAAGVGGMCAAVAGILVWRRRALGAHGRERDARGRDESP
jgi:hypothetical protein